MTLDDLCVCTSEQLAKITDEEMTTILSPWYNVTRPELIQRPLPRSDAVAVDPVLLSKIRQLQALGIDASHLLRKKK